MVHKRTFRALASAPFDPRHYRALGNILRHAEEPVDFLRRYVWRSGTYPHRVPIRGRNGQRLDIMVHSAEDMQTINEIFFRNDYPVTGSEQVVVDFGSNIGISALWFLTSSPSAFAYLYEPVPANVERLRANLAPFAGRFALAEVAVGTSAGMVSFGIESSGRYGGIGRPTGETIEVPCEDSNAILAGILARHERIDILKIDIETLEQAVTQRIPEPVARRIDSIYVEYPFTANPLGATHDMERGTFMTWFRRRADGSGSG
jgi:FkbM family methyltransferase